MKVTSPKVVCNQGVNRQISGAGSVDDPCTSGVRYGLLEFNIASVEGCCQ